MRTQAEIDRDREKDEALLRMWDEAQKRIDRTCEDWAYLRGYYDGMQGKVVTLPGDSKEEE